MSKNMTPLEQAASMMGYRRVKENWWFKPAGYHCFVINTRETEQTWANRFVAHESRDLATWTTRVFKETTLTELLREIKGFEADDPINKGHWDTHFELNVNPMDMGL